MTVADANLLCQLLQKEEHEYRRLLRLAWRQGAYLRRHDVERLEKNAGQWQKYLRQAQYARQQRERFTRQLGQELGLGERAAETQFLAEFADYTNRTSIERAVQSLVQIAGDLVRQNEMNRQLAKFCLDLAQEEMRIFKQCVLEDPAGCYEGDATKTSAPPGGVLVKKA
ncbi:MAG: flagellar export chaperone FlgN [bacterium]